MTRTRTFIHVLSSLRAKEYSPLAVISRPSIENFYDAIEVTEENNYRINKTIEINKDFEFPVGIYHLNPEVGIVGKNCHLQISPGTIFYFNDHSFLHLEGRLDAIGTEQGKIQFLTEEFTTNAHITFNNLEARLEHCRLAGFQTSNINSTQPLRAMQILNSKANLVSFEVSENQGHVLGTVNSEKSQLKLQDCLFKQNIPASVGALNLDQTDLEMYNTIFRNNYTPLDQTYNMGIALMALKEEKVYAEDCEFSCNNGGIAVCLAKSAGSVFKKTVFRNNFEGAIFCYGGKIEFDDECSIEGCGSNPFSPGTGSPKLIYPASIIKNNEPGAKNLPLLRDKIIQKNKDWFQENDIPRLIKAAKENYSLGDSETNALEYELKRILKNRKSPIDDFFTD